LPLSLFHFPTKRCFPFNTKKYDDVNKKIREDFFIFEKIFSHSSKVEGIHPFQIEKIDNKFEALQWTRPSEALSDGLITDEVIARVKV
jgi:hypothetical protein